MNFSNESLLRLTEQRHAGSRAANALAAALGNPYGNRGWLPGNYALQYGQNSAATSSRRTAEGYTFSSTYASNAEPLTIPLPEPSELSIPNGTSKSATQNSRNPPRPFWLTPGNFHCKYPGCNFRASQQSVEIHMMDRHLIYPKNWKEEKHWDADQSLKGKEIPVSGTSTILNTPQAIDEWIQERRKRWPTSQRVEERVTRRSEALKRGELEMDSLKHFPKRRKIDAAQKMSIKAGTMQQSGGPTIKDLPPQSENQKGLDSSTSVITEIMHKVTKEIDASDDDGPPEEIPFNSKSCSRIIDPDETRQNISEKEKPRRGRPARDRDKKYLPSSKHASGNNVQNSLLHSLLLPEIHHSVSNLSQAIHFIVENSFFDGVELFPGDAQYKRIQMLPPAFPIKDQKES